MAKSAIKVTMKDKAYVIRLTRDEGNAVARVLKALKTKREVTARAEAAGSDPATIERFFRNVLNKLCESKKVGVSKVIVIDVE